ncbi:MAG TPA: hypothetical protein VG520_00895 [Candidatus Dormibacteraeota bacterium]|nr:hypothetical protein [Candidatus Dormibacteraeota bacterium]
MLVVVLVAGAVFVSVRALAAPDLGPAPGGTSHGNSEVVIAAALAGDAATQLVFGEHAEVTLSERDLTVIANARNPSPDRFRNPQARVRNGDVVVSGNTSVGPFGLTAVVRFAVLSSNASGSTQVTARAVDYSVGQLGVPGFLADRVNPRGSASVNLTALFASNPILEGLSQSLDCVVVHDDGVHVGFHRPGAGASAATCG